MFRLIGQDSEAREVGKGCFLTHYPMAANDLFEIRDYFENILKIKADCLFGKFYSHLEKLEGNPLIHPLVGDKYLRRLGNRMIPIDKYLVFMSYENHTYRSLIVYSGANPLLVKG